ncbi:MAG: T9SS type A sorting domain-containing protein [Dysgonomonas sp.]
MKAKIFTTLLLLFFLKFSYSQDVTIKTNYVGEDFSFTLQTYRLDGKLKIDWNGQVQDLGLMPTGQSQTYTSPYSLSGNATIKIYLDNKLEYFAVTAQNVTDIIVNNPESMITTIKCGESDLVNLDVANASLLEEITLSKNKLATLNLSANNNLKRIVIDGNPLTSVQLPATLASAASLNIGQTLLSEASISGILSKMPNLTSLTINNDQSENKLTVIDLSANTELEDLNLLNNGIEVLNLSNNTKLKSVRIGNNKIRTISLNAPLLETLSCPTNELTLLDVSSCTNLVTLGCSYNNLKKLDLSKNLLLKSVICSSNDISSLVIDESVSLDQLDCTKNKLHFGTFPRVSVASGGYLYTGQDSLSVKATTERTIDISRYLVTVTGTVPGTTNSPTTVITWLFQKYGGGSPKAIAKSLYTEVNGVYTFQEDASLKGGIIYAKLKNAAFPKINFLDTKGVDFDDPSVGIGENKVKDVVVSYNSSNGNLYYQAENVEAVQIINISGRTVYSEKVNTSQGEISLLDQPSGVYVVVVKTADSRFAKKIVK